MTGVDHILDCIGSVVYLLTLLAFVRLFKWLVRFVSFPVKVQMALSTLLLSVPTWKLYSIELVSYLKEYIYACTYEKYQDT